MTTAATGSGIVGAFFEQGVGLLEGVLEHEGHGVAVVREGKLAAQQLVEHGGDCVDVGRRAELAAPGLFGAM